MKINIEQGPPSQALLDHLRGRYRFRLATALLALLLYAWMAPRTPPGFRFISGCGCAFWVYLATRTYYRLYVARQFDPVDVKLTHELQSWTGCSTTLAGYVDAVHQQGRHLTGFEYDALREHYQHEQS